MSANSTNSVSALARNNAEMRDDSRVGTSDETRLFGRKQYVAIVAIARTAPMSRKIIRDLKESSRNGITIVANKSQH